MSSLPVVWSDTTLAHRPDREVWVGVPMVGSEVGERVTVIRDALETAGHSLVLAQPHGEAPLTRVHSADLVRHLRDVYDMWVAGGFLVDPGQDRVVPYFFPTAAMLGTIPATRASSVHARAGQFCYDTMTTVGPGTWAAACAAVDCALTAVDLVVAGARRAYGLCRPPGHHATRDGYGGSCYLNNAAIAAAALVDFGHERVAIIDVDAHHGNGTAAIFYDHANVLYGSVHVDPRAGWFPHVVGHASETGTGVGKGATINIPLAEASGDDAFLDGVVQLADATMAHSATALVVSLGVDAAADDPESPLEVTSKGFSDAGVVLLRELDLPTVIVQEGGYHLPTLGSLVAAFLTASR